MQNEFVLVVGYQALLLHVGQRDRHCRAVYAQIIRQLLPAIGNGKRQAATTQRLGRQERQELFLRCALAHVRHLPVQPQRLARERRQKISHDAHMIHARIRARSRN